MFVMHAGIPSTSYFWHFRNPVASTEREKEREQEKDSLCCHNAMTVCRLPSTWHTNIVIINRTHTRFIYQNTHSYMLRLYTLYNYRVWVLFALFVLAYTVAAVKCERFVLRAHSICGRTIKRLRSIQ